MCDQWCNSPWRRLQCTNNYFRQLLEGGVVGAMPLEPPTWRKIPSQASPFEPIQFRKTRQEPKPTMALRHQDNSPSRRRLIFSSFYLIVCKRCCCKLLENFYRLIIVQNESSIDHVTEVLHSEQFVVRIAWVIHQAYLQKQPWICMIFDSRVAAFRIHYQIYKLYLLQQLLSHFMLVLHFVA